MNNHEFYSFGSGNIVEIKCYGRKRLKRIPS